MHKAFSKMALSTARRTPASQMHESGTQGAMPGGTVYDGTKDYQPLRSKQYDLKKPHITETPITWTNWYRHVNWLNSFFIFGVPVIGFVAAYYHPLQLWTAVFSVIYYFNTGLGITAGMHDLQFFIARCKRLELTQGPTQDTTVSGRTLHTKPHCLYRYTWQRLVSEQLRALSGGGRKATGHITVTQTPSRTRIPSGRASSMHTSAGSS